MKKLRKKYGEGVRFFACGEYGKDGKRLWNPHYHAILFNLDFEDKILWTENGRGDPVFTSQSLSDLWQQGFCTVAAASFQSAAYVSRYIMKKVTGELASDHYQWIDTQTGECLQLTPEFVTMSRGSAKLKTGGIGRGWYDKFADDVFPDDFIVIEGKKMRPPKYYDDLLDQEDESERRHMKGARRRKGKVFEPHNTPERRKVREKVKEAQISKLGREL